MQSMFCSSGVELTDAVGCQTRVLARDFVKWQNAPRLGLRDEPSRFFGRHWSMLKSRDCGIEIRTGEPRLNVCWPLHDKHFTKRSAGIVPEP